MFPVSLFTHMAVTSASSLTDNGPSTGRGRPVASTVSGTRSNSGSGTGSPAGSHSQSTASPTAGCSTGELWIRRAPWARSAPKASPCTAMLSASVPEPVNRTSARSAPSRAPICSRASSTIRDAARPEAYWPAGFSRAAVRSSASTASGRSGADAAWSR